LEAALQPSDIETASDSLNSLVRLAVTESAIEEGLEHLRNSFYSTDRDRDMVNLTSLLAKEGIFIGNTFNAFLSNRLLKDGMDNESDKLINDLILNWRRLEEKSGYMIPLRNYCYLASLDTSYTTKLGQLASKLQFRSTARQLLYNLLWTQSGELRQSFIESGHYNPYRGNRKNTIDSSLLRELLIQEELPEVDLNSTDYLEDVVKHLKKKKGVILKANRSQESLLAEKILEINLLPIDYGYLQFFPSCVRFYSDENELKAVFSLRVGS